MLMPEPDNPYDSSAVKVLLPVTSLPDSVKAIDLDGTGYTMEELVSAGEPIQLGYLAAVANRQLAQRQMQGEQLVSNVEILNAVGLTGDLWPCQAKLLFAIDGQATVQVTV
jgi:hypothetical protein